MKSRIEFYLNVDTRVSDSIQKWMEIADGFENIVKIPGFAGAMFGKERNFC